MQRALVWMVYMFVSAAASAEECKLPATRVHVVRHGETDWNAGRRLQGHTDVPLNTNGIEQAREASVEWTDRPLAAVFSSDLSRAKVTAEILTQGKELACQVDERLRERSYGRFEGLVYDEFRRQAGPEMKDIEGEDLLRTRVLSMLSDVASKHAGQEVLVVSHGGVLATLLEHVTHVDGPKWKIDNLAHLTLDYVDGAWTVVEMDRIHRR